MEKWKKVDGFPGYYVSDKGNLKSIDRLVKRVKKNGEEYYSSLKGRNIKATLDKHGYYKVNIADSSGKKKNRFIHRLVGIAFIDNPEHKPVINHKDANKTNNRLENLEWATLSENHQHAQENDLIAYPTGEKHWRGKKVAQYAPCGKLVNIFGSACLASKETGFHVSSISRAALGRVKPKSGYSWRYI